MRLFKLLLITIAWALAIPMSHAISLDSLLNLPAMGLPVLNYSPESTWEFGAAAQGYFRLPNQERTSIIQLDGTYSLNHQWYINAQGSLYFGNKKHTLSQNTIPHSWHLQFRLGYSDRPATYYGIGNEGNTPIGLLREGTPYTLQRGYATIQTPITVSRGWAVGPMADFTYANYEIERNKYRIMNIGVGAVALYDTRDITFYPTRGIFFKTTAQFYATNLQTATHLTVSLSADLRQYIPLPHDIVVVWQLKSQWFISQHSISDITIYPLLPRLGGQDGLRGIHSDMFRDDVMMAFQAELRIPIWSIFRATIFAGVGDVYDLHNWHWEIPKVGYGIGLRAAINKAKVNIRFDIARSNVDPRWNTINAYSFYLTATEAF